MTGKIPEAKSPEHQRLLESELRFRQLVENIREVFYLTNADGTEVLYVSPAYEAVWGRPCEELRRDPASRIDAILREDVVHQRHGAEGYELSYRIRRPDGTLRWIHDRGFPIRDAAGEIYRIAGIAEDVTARVAMEGELRERKDHLRRAQELARLAHIVTGPDGGFASWSETLPGLLGGEVPASTREWLGRAHPEDRARLREHAIAAARDGSAFRLEYRLLDTQGRITNVRQLTEPIVTGRKGARPGAWFNILQDVTEQRAAEDARRESDRRAEDEVRRANAELGQRVAERTAELEAANRELESYDYSISHDLRAPLNRIRGFSNALLEDHGATLSPAGQDYLRRIVRSAESLEQMVSDILRLSTWTKVELSRSAVSVTAIARAVLNGLERSQPARQVKWSVAPDLEADADAGLVRVALDNLIGNAWKFTANRVEAAIEVGGSTIGAERVFWVRDNGPGFDSAEAGSLFQPFKRLRSSGDFPGSGVGLATVHRIVRRHRGRIWAEAQAGEGATFYFTLAPAAPS